MKTLRGRIKMNNDIYRIRIVIEAPKKPANDIANFLKWMLYRKGVQIG